MSRPTLLQVLRCRLKLLLQLQGLSPSGVARDMGRAHTWLARKLDADHTQARPLLVQDIDEVLAHLELPGTRLLRAVLLPGDRELLRFIAATDNPTAADVAAVFARDDEALARLAEQGLVATFDNTLTLTDGGVTAATP